MNDPYYVVKEELLILIETLDSTFDEYKLTNDQSKSSFLLSELKKSMNFIDINYIKIIENVLERIKQNRIQFSNIKDDEILEREKFLNTIKNKLSLIQDEINNPKKINEKKIFHNPYEEALKQDNKDFIEKETQTQQYYEMKAIEGLDRIERRLEDVHDMALSINSAARQDIIDLDRISEDIDVADGRIKSTIKKINNLIDQTSDCYILLFIGVLILLIIALITIVVSI